MYSNFIQESPLPTPQEWTVYSNKTDGTYDVLFYNPTNNECTAFCNERDYCVVLSEFNNACHIELDTDPRMFWCSEGCARKLNHRASMCQPVNH